jgi:hypothetical protein
VREDVVIRDGGKPAKIRNVTVNNVEQLIEAIAPNTHIVLEPGVYNLGAYTKLKGYSALTNASQLVNEYLAWEEVHDGLELVIKDVENLTIEGSALGTSEIVTPYRYAYVINFENCKNLLINRIKSGHIVTSDCAGGVFSFNNCSDVLIKNTLMYGCGIIGIDIHNSDNISVRNSSIYKCSYGIVWIYNSRYISFTDCDFFDNQFYDCLIYLNGSNDVTLNGCKFIDNFRFSDKDARNFITAEESAKITVRNSTINNIVENGIPYSGVVRFEDNKLSEETSAQEELGESELSPLSSSTQQSISQSAQEPLSPKITIELAKDVEAAIVELLARFPCTIYNNKDKEIINDTVIYNGLSDIGFHTGDLFLFDLDNNSKPYAIIHTYCFYGEGQSADIYKFINGEYVEIGSTTIPFSFYNDNKKRLVLYAGGDEYISSYLEYSYIDTSTGVLLRDTVDIDGKLNWYSPDKEPDDPRIIDKSLKRITKMAFPLNIYNDAKRLAYKRLATARANAKTMLALNGRIVSYDIAVFEYDGKFYIPAQDMADFLGAKLEYNELSNTTTLFFKNNGICEIVNGSNIRESSSNSEKMYETEYSPQMINDVLMFPAVCRFNMDYFNYESYYIPDLNLIYVF